MKTTYNPSLRAHVLVDEKNKVRHIRHSQEYWQSEDNIPRVSAESYLNEWAETLQIPKDQLKNLHRKVSFYDPQEQDIEYQLHEEKHMFDSTTVGYYQTYLNTPVWRKGLSVKIKQNPNRVVGSTNNSEDGIRGKLPDAETIERYKKIFRQAAARKAAVDAGLGEGEGKDETASFVRKVINVKAPPTSEKSKEGKVSRDDDEARLLSGKFFIYKYDPKKRYAGKPSPPDEKKTREAGEEREIPLLKIPPVADGIETGRAYLVAEMIFKFKPPGFSGLVWLILVEIETGAILCIECMTCGVNGLVFKWDPMVSSGDLTITADQSNGVLDDHDFDETLNDLDGPSGGNQSLSGLYVVVQEEDAINGEEINAFWSPNGTGGTDFLGFCLCDLSDFANPLCRAVDPYVHWHEMGGHGTLGDHVGSGKSGILA